MGDGAAIFVVFVGIYFTLTLATLNMSWHERGAPFDDDVWELYDLSKDPNELVNLAARPDAAVTMARLDTPSPSEKRPGAMWPSVAAVIPRTMGVRVWIGSTPVAISSRVV